MTPKFLRDEAARFRGMAEDADREASRLRLLAMAEDYEARAVTADALAGPRLNDVIELPLENAVETAESVEAEPVKPKASGRIVRGLKETVLPVRRTTRRLV